MTLAGDAPDLERFRNAIAQRFGLCFEDTRAGFLAEVLQRRLDATGSARFAYLESLASLFPAPSELRALARELTVGETYFFRHREQFQAFQDVAVPACLAARAASRCIRVLSAGCASGEEAYTIAILLRERGLDPAWQIAIRAVDLNAAALERATAGRYSEWSLRETPPAVRQRWFSPDGRELALDRSLRECVSFEERNLAREDAELWLPAGYDVVFCRNVIMYLTPAVARDVIARISRSLAPGGHLFLGHAETLRGLSHDFALRHSHNTFYYERKPEAARALPAAVLAPFPVSVPVAEAPWLETVQRAAERIERLARKPARDAAPVRAAARRTDLGPAFELLQQERFADALLLLGESPVGPDADVEHLLLRAVLLAHSGQTGAAEAVCARLLEQDELNAGAHYVLALCREESGDHKGAVDHDQAAVYLDPSFAMPRLHLGLMARRAGDREVALTELAEAALLLLREDSSRLLLFGGGFRREALINLCRAELGAAGALP